MGKYVNIIIIQTKGNEYEAEEMVGKNQRL
jgi:hypothetical protein